MAPTWFFLVLVMAALCVFGVAIAVMVMVFRAATRATGPAPGETRRDDSGNMAVPPVIVDDSLTNPANPLYHLHHPTDPGASPSSFDFGPTSSPSFDTGNSASPSVDSGSSSMGSDSGSNCG